MFYDEGEGNSIPLSTLDNISDLSLEEGWLLPWSFDPKEKDVLGYCCEKPKPLSDFSKTFLKRR